MASVSFQNIEKTFGTTKVIHGIGFDISDGEFMVLVGPSGCGKSTLLRMLAGLEEISAGTISIDGRVVNDMESKDRDIAMVFQINALHQRLKTTTVYVTHDQVEAMTMADRIVVMHDGRVEQIGTPLELYDRPGNLFVAQFIGSPAMNVIEGTVRRANGAAHVEAGAGIRWPLGNASGGDGQRVAYGIRPEHLTLASATAAGAVAGEIIVVEPTGAETELLVQAGEAQIVLVTHGRPVVNPGDKIGLAVDPAMVHVFDKASGQRIAA